MTCRALTPLEEQEMRDTADPSIHGLRLTRFKLLTECHEWAYDEARGQWLLAPVVDGTTGLRVAA